MTMLNTIKSGSRAALVALALGASAFTAVPAAQAQSFNFDFGITGGGGPSFSFGIGNNGQRFRRDCLTTREVTRGLQRNGFSRIRVISENRRTFRLSAEYGRRGQLYTMTVNRCSGEVYNIERARRGHGGPGSGFNIR